MMRKQDVPPIYMRLYNRAVNGGDPKVAIRCFCVMCFGWCEADVQGCKSKACPLWKYRDDYRETTE